MRDVDRRLTFWMAGYYDDFIGARALPDDLNTQGTTWSSAKSHHGNPINGWANLNTRYTYAWCERGDGASGRFNNAAIATADQYKHNGGINEWLAYDQNRRNAGTYEGTAQLQYPDSLTNANRQRFDGGTGILGQAYKAADAKDAYLLFSYGYNTANRYYSAIGTNDSSYGRATSKTPDYDAGSTSTLHSTAGIPTGVSAPTTVVRTHLAGVYSGEVLFNDAYTNSAPKAYLYPIESAAGKPFLVSEVYMTSTSYAPVLSFDGSLNSKGDGDIFTMRVHACAVDTSSARFKLSIGCEGTAFTSAASGDTGYSRAAIELEITPVAYQESTSATYASPPTVASLWDDYDFVIDYTNNRYTLYKNGTAVATNQAMTTKADGTNFTAAEMYGWMIQAKSCSKKAAVLIDRVGLVRPLNDYPSGLEMPPAVSMAYNTSVNAVSTLNLTLIDDDAQLNLLEFFNASSYADWSLLMFRDNIDRPLWRGSINSLNYSMGAVERTPTIKLSAQDYFSSLDQQIPTWELGDSGDADSTASVAYNRSEAQNNLNTYYFGASRLVSANATLGFNEVDDGSGVFLAHKDSRMRNRSAHPIQMYGDEDTSIGPTAPYSNWDDACDDGTAAASAQYRALHSRWMQDFKNSLWFKHMFSRIEEDAVTTTLASAFTVGDTQIDLVDYCGSIVSGGSIEIIDADGTLDSGVITSASATTSTAIVATDWIVHGSSQQPFSYKWFAVMYIAASAWNSNMNDKTMTITGCSNANLNGQWRPAPMYVTDSSGGFSALITRNGVACVRLILREATNTRPSPFSFDIFSFTGTRILQTVQTGVVYDTNPTVLSDANAKPAVGTGQVLTTEATGGTLQMLGTTAVAPATNFFQRDHDNGATVKIRSHTDDYKHVWVMWADMRNDGSADADLGFRKKNFGLMAPYSQNYAVSMVLADSTVSNDSERQEFIDLAIGTDVDLWQMDATQDPITGNTWSSVNSDSFTPDSFTGSDDNRYKNWEGKAGSFVFVDASKFFNLNTESNGGRTGQASGGRKEIGDYLVETEGFPVLIDNYWERAPTGPYNLDGADSANWNSNYKHFNSRSTTLLVGFESGDNLLQLTDDIINFPSSGGVAGSITSQSKEKIFHFNATSQPAAVTGMTVAADGQGVVAISGSSDVIKYFRTGQQIVISSSNTTPNIDGTHTIIADNGLHGTSNWEIKIAIDISTTMSSGGTATIIGAGATYIVETMVDLGMPVEGTTAVDEWNGAGYGNGNNDAESLVQHATSFFFGNTNIDIPIEKEEGLNQDAYEDATVHVGLANVFPMRLMMQVDGFIENEASLTFNENDKFRVTWLDSLTQNWLTQSSLYGIPSLASIPVMGNMTTTQTDASAGSVGGIISASTGTISGKVTIAGNNQGLPVEGNLFDGDIVEIVNNSQLSLAIDDYKTRYVVSEVGVGGVPFNFNVTAAGKSGTANAGYWRKVGSVDTFGSVNDCRNTTIANIFSSTQSGSGIGNIDGTRSVMSWLMGRDSQPSFRPTYGNGFVFNTTNLKISNLNTESGGQISNVRVFYNGGTAFVDYPSATLGTRPRWDIINVDSVTSRNEALIVAKQEYEKNKAAPFAVTAEIIRFSDSHTLNGLNDTMLYEARYGYVADQSRTIPRTCNLAGSYTDDKAWAWASLWGGNLFSGIQNALDGRDGATPNNTDEQGTLAYSDNYYWLGSNSLSYAMQVVHVPQGMPKTTMKTPSSGDHNADGHLRIAIDIDDRQDAFVDPNLAMFRIYLLDYDWDSGIVGATPTLRSSSSISVASNGLYEIGIPSTYWSDQAGNEKMVISVNYDYLTSLLRNRCGGSNTHLNAHDWAGVTYSKGHNTDSIFPLGVRKFGQADYWNKNAEWYAPRLHIVDDWNFVPATTLTYTDAQMGLSNEKLSIRSINWSINGRDSEALSIGLERDVSRAAKNFTSYILPKVARGGVQSSGQGNQGGGGGSSSGGGTTSGETGGRGGGDNAGDTKAGGWQDWAGWGDGGVAQTSSAQLNPITNPNRISRPDGLSTSMNGVYKLSSSSLGNAALNRVKGTMDFNNDSVTGGSFGVLGQTKPTAAPRDGNGISGIDSFISPTSGDAIMGEDGMVFAGAGDWVSPPTSFTATARIPPNAQSNSLRVFGRASMGAATGSAVLLVTVECVEAAVKYTSTVSVGQVERGNVVLFSGRVVGADVSNNTIKVTVERNAGQGDDNASHASVELHNIQIATDNRSVAGKSQSSSFTYSE